LPEKVTIRTFEAEVANDANGRRNYKKTDRQRDVKVPYYIDYYPTRSVRFPFAYLLTNGDPEIIGLLKRHGIKLEKLIASSKIEVERFEISELKGDIRLNQGHYTNTIKGSFVSESKDFPAGTIVIRTAQSLANLAAYLLEPQSNDGLVVWNFLDRCLVPQWGVGYNPYPVYKILGRVDLKSVETR
jgi:hypothetical protein